MELKGSGKGREVLVTLNVERETGRIHRSDRLRQQYGAEQPPQGNPQLGSRYLIADVEAEQLMRSAGLEGNQATPGTEMVIAARGDLQETGRAGSYRLDPDSVQPGRPMTPATRLIEDRIASRAQELDAEGRTLAPNELDSIVSQAERDDAAGPDRDPAAVPNRGAPIRPARREPVQQPAGDGQSPDQQRRAPKRELPIPVVMSDLRRNTDRAGVTGKDNVGSAAANGLATGIGNGLRVNAAMRTNDTTGPETSAPAGRTDQPGPDAADEGTARAESRLEQFPELRGAGDGAPAQQGADRPAARFPELSGSGDRTAASGVEYGADHDGMGR